MHSEILAKNCELGLLVQKIYKIIVHTIAANNTIVNSASLVRNMLFNLGFGYAWRPQSVTNRTYVISLFKQRLRDQYIQQWFTSVSTRSSCSLYKNIANRFRCQNYFHMATNCKHKISCQIFISTSFLVVNKVYFCTYKKKLRAKHALVCMHTDFKSIAGKTY